MKRNYGIDFLRIVSMFMVVILHVLGQGGILDNAESASQRYWIAWLFEISCYCAVNCFALISGYVMSQTKYKLSRVFNLWFQTVFYTGLATIVFFFVPEAAVGGRAILNAVFPISSQQYWYISAYFGILIFVPALNAAIEHTEKKTLNAILIAAFVAFCILPIAFQTTPYGLSGGYSVIWLSLLYLVGGYLRKYGITNNIKTKYAWITVFAMIALTFFSKFVLETFFQSNPFFLSYKSSLISYTSPTMVLIAIALLVICSKMSFKPKAAKIISFLSPAVLGVYLLHVNPLVWKHIVKDFAKGFLNYNSIGMIGSILLSALLIFVAGICVDLVRIKLFAVLKLNNFSLYLEKKLLKEKEKV